MPCSGPWDCDGATARTVLQTKAAGSRGRRRISRCGAVSGCRWREAGQLCRSASWHNHPDDFDDFREIEQCSSEVGRPPRAVARAETERGDARWATYTPGGATQYRRQSPGVQLTCCKRTITIIAVVYHRMWMISRNRSARMPRGGLKVTRFPSARPSVTRRYCVKTADISSHFFHNRV